MPNQKGTIAMARTPDIDSANTEFFFNLADNSASLGPSDDNPGYTAFGEVIVGMNVLETMAELPATNQGGIHLLERVIPMTIREGSR
jgi:cyclophilin family peptidyl-prolyl cis-trans isomerase